MWHLIGNINKLRIEPEACGSSGEIMFSAPLPMFPSHSPLGHHLIVTLYSSHRLKCRHTKVERHPKQVIPATLQLLVQVDFAVHGRNTVPSHLNSNRFRLFEIRPFQLKEHTFD